MGASRSRAETRSKSIGPLLGRLTCDGEHHANNPVVIRGLQKARDAADGSPERAPREGGHAYDTFTSHVYNRPASAIRDLIELTPARGQASLYRGSFLSNTRSAGLSMTRPWRMRYNPAS